MKNIFKITFGFLLLSVITFYLGIVFLLPQIINSKIIINKLQSIIHDKTGIETNIIGLNLKISPKLIAVLNVDSIDAKNKHVTVVDIKKFSINYMLLQKNLTSISASNIYIDGNSLKQFKKTQKNKKSNKFELKNLPEINIKNLVYKSDEISIYTKNINTEKDTIHLNIDVKTPYLKETLKLGYSGSLQVIENKLKANKLEIKLGNSSGQNWWCVLYPSLCFVDVSSGALPDSSKEELQNVLSEEQYSLISENTPTYNFKFKLVELFNTNFKISKSTES